jgi:hypothetical protein
MPTHAWPQATRPRTTLKPQTVRVPAHSSFIFVLSSFSPGFIVIAHSSLPLHALHRTVCRAPRPRSHRHAFSVPMFVASSVSHPCCSSVPVRCSYPSASSPCGCAALCPTGHRPRGLNARSKPHPSRLTAPSHRPLDRLRRPERLPPAASSRPSSRPARVSASR